MIPPIIKDALVYANLLLMLSIGFTLTYLTAKIPNFAHGTLAGIGVYIAFTVARILKLNAYLALPIAFLIVGIVELALYITVIGTLKRMGATFISLTIATIALEIIISASINIYADYISRATGVFSRAFLMRKEDFNLFGLPGALIVSSILVATLITTLHLMLTRTKFGIAMRATVENPALAEMMGINTEKVTAISWFLTGGLAGLAGALLPLWFQGYPEIGNQLIVSVFASSVLGGLSSIYGAMIGGYIVGLTEVLGTKMLASLIGAWITAYRLLIPLTVLSIVLLIAPRGISGIIEDIMLSKALYKQKIMSGSKGG